MGICKRLARLALLGTLVLTPALSGADENPDSGAFYSTTGKASYYSARLHGKLTANGERYDQSALTAAHPSLPFGTILCVTNLYNGRSVVVRINDRGPFVGGRIIDLSRQAAEQIGMIRAGSVRVRIERCEEPV